MQFKNQKGEKKAMKAQQKAYGNYLASQHYGGDGTSFKKPLKNIGYGKLLIALATLPESKRTSRKAINLALGWRVYSNGQVHCVTTYNRLTNAKLIEKKKNGGAYSLTKLGRAYAKEMKLI